MSLFLFQLFQYTFLVFSLSPLNRENGKKKLWSNDMKIIRKPGLSLNRYLKINDILGWLYRN